METTPEHSDTIVQAIIGLHNFLIAEGEVQRNNWQADDNTEVSSGLTSANMRNPHANRVGATADHTRDNLIAFFNGVGAVGWQDKYSKLVNVVADQ